MVVACVIYQVVNPTRAAATSISKSSATLYRDWCLVKVIALIRTSLPNGRFSIASIQVTCKHKGYDTILCTVQVRGGRLASADIVWLSSKIAVYDMYFAAIGNVSTVTFSRLVGMNLYHVPSLVKTNIGRLLRAAFLTACVPRAHAKTLAT